MVKTTDKQPAKGIKPVAIEDRIKRIEATLKKIESKVSDDAAFRLFVQSLVKERNEQAKTAEEQGLQPGDYTDASKEVADELTAMGWGWYDSDRCEHKFIVRMNKNADCAKMINTYTRRYGHDKRLPRPEFIARARVTAKRLGLVPVEQPKFEKGTVVRVTGPARSGTLVFELGAVCKLAKASGTTGAILNPIDGPEDDQQVCYPLSSFLVMSPEEVAKHREEQELAKPIVPYETRVMHEGKEWRVIGGPFEGNEYRLYRKHEDNTVYRTRHEFTVIP